MRVPLIFDIKRASTADGPGLRTVIFFKGCNLDCFWCHNPEGKSMAPQMAFFADKCVSCGVCREVCQKGEDPCKGCGECAATCPAGARKRYGREYTAEELLGIILADKAYFEATGGGVTFSGGECMLFPDFLATLAKSCRNNGVSVAVDTAGNVPFSSFERVLPHTDLFLYDIKALDPKLHREGTGVDNRLILDNLDRLIEKGARLHIRVPVIPGFNEGAETARIEAFCRERQLSYELLPYHAFGESKRDALGRI